MKNSALGERLFSLLSALPYIALALYFLVKHGLPGKRTGPLKDKKGKSCIVIGNGPSLKQDIERISRTDNTDFICVNHFADSSYFEEVKPEFYVFLDPYFWRNDAHESFINKRKKTFELIVEKTSWPLTILIPYYAKAWGPHENFTQNKFVKTVYYSAAQTKGLPDCISHRLFDTGLFTPPSINVLVHSVFLAVRLGYSRVQFYGADTSWHESLSLNQETNELLIKYTHFYGESLEPVFMDCQKKLKSNVSHELWKVSETLKWYASIGGYAGRTNTLLLNGSSYSWIDSITRNNKPE